MSTAFGIQQTSAGVGTTAADMRHILAAQWESTGVVDGLAVTGGTSLAYRVASGVCVCSRASSDGKTLAWVPGGSSPAVAAADASSPRIDVVWVTAHDATQGDADNLVTIGVTQGTPAATPSAPSIPAYATELARMLLPAGATTTANSKLASSVGYAVPYGASLGVLHSYTSTFDGTADSSSTWYVEDSATIYLPTDRLVEFRYSRCMSCDAGGSIMVELYLDGTPFVQSEMGADAHWETHLFSTVKQVGAGNHTFSVRNRHQSGGTIYYHYAAGSARGSSSLSGMRFELIDRGVVR